MTYSCILYIVHAGGTSINFLSARNEDKAVANAMAICDGLGKTTLKEVFFDYVAKVGFITVEVM